MEMGPIDSSLFVSSHHRRGPIVSPYPKNDRAPPPIGDMRELNTVDQAAIATG